MTIIKEIFRNMFMSGKPIFRIDRNRYAHTRKEFPDLEDITDLSKLKFDGFEIDKVNLRGDLSNVFTDLSRSFEAYKKENLNQSNQHEQAID